MAKTESWALPALRISPLKPSDWYILGSTFCPRMDPVSYVKYIISSYKERVEKLC